MKSTFFLTLFFCSTTLTYSRTLEVGTGREFARLQNAAAQAQPGDTILLREGIYSGGDYIENLQGTPSAWITVLAATGEKVVFRGSSQAFHMTDPAYVRIEGLDIEEQTGNGINIDDGGTYASPAHHIVIENCSFGPMGATGNNDELKLSGVDDFIISNCSFTAGAAGGSLIDMVGCHRGNIQDNSFAYGASSSVQAKGGSKDIRIERNSFRGASQRAINIGGSTGLPYFRPLSVNYEASNIYVYSNYFDAGDAPVAFVGAVNCEVVNNTLLYPGRWAVRILQETTEPGFLPCGNNTFRNNIVVLGSIATAVNIGPNTSPESFTFSHNLWYNESNPNWQGPNTPVEEPGRIINLDPFPIVKPHVMCVLDETSPAVGKGYDVGEPVLDCSGKPFATPRSIGAKEGAVPSRVDTVTALLPVITPNPATGEVMIRIARHHSNVTIADIRGATVWQGIIEREATIDIRSWPSGAYLVQWDGRSRILIKE